MRLCRVGDTIASGAPWCPPSLSALAIVGLLCGAARAEPRIERFEGIARTGDGAIAYRERHEVEYQGDRPVQSTTRYFDAAGRKIAELRSDYRADPYAPGYSFEVPGRTQESARLSGGGILLRHDAQEKLLSVDANGPLVVLGQGMHQLVRAKLDALAAGQELVVRLAVPSRLEAYDFRIERQESRDPAVVRLRIKIDNWLISLLAPSLEVEYDRATRRLLRYRGISNLPGEGDDPLQVEIRYLYETDARPVARDRG